MQLPRADSILCTGTGGRGGPLHAQSESRQSRVRRFVKGQPRPTDCVDQHRVNALTLMLINPVKMV